MRSLSIIFLTATSRCVLGFVPIQNRRFDVTFLLPTSSSKYTLKSYENICSSSSALYSESPSSSSKDDTSQEWHPFDPASTTPQLLSALWIMISNACDMSRGESLTIRFPNMQNNFTPSYMERLMHHLDVCKDVCDSFGADVTLLPYTETNKGRSSIAGFTVKSYRNPNKMGTLPQDGDYKFAPDPYWDENEDWTVMQQSLIEAEDMDDLGGDDGSSSKLSDLPDFVDPVVPEQDDAILDVTKAWVSKMMSDMGICPFTSGAEMAGLPMGKVFYTIDRCINVEDMYARYWKEVVRLEQNTEKELSTTLLIVPEFYRDNVELFDNFSNSLTQPLESLQIEDLIQLVFFHPQWTFRDGGERAGERGAANYARRSPWPMINILRTKQVRTAQRGIPTGLVYQQNEKTLSSVGSKKLETMLRRRDWSDIEGMKVNRRDMEALRIAQDLQQTGILTEKDTTFQFDSAPAATKVSRGQIEGGNLINVLLQALEKRLAGGRNGRLSGAETSAAMMASDFLLSHLDELQKTPVTVTPRTSLLDAYSDDSDQFSSSIVSEEDEESVLFGGGGIKMNSMEDEEEDFSSASAFNRRRFF